MLLEHYSHGLGRLLSALHLLHLLPCHFHLSPCCFVNMLERIDLPQDFAQRLLDHRRLVTLHVGEQSLNLGAFLHDERLQCLRHDLGLDARFLHRPDALLLCHVRRHLGDLFLLRVLVFMGLSRQRLASGGDLRVHLFLVFAGRRHSHGGDLRSNRREVGVHLRFDFIAELLRSLVPVLRRCTGLRLGRLLRLFLREQLHRGLHLFHLRCPGLHKAPQLLHEGGRLIFPLLFHPLDLALALFLYPPLFPYHLHGLGHLLEDFAAFCSYSLGLAPEVVFLLLQTLLHILLQLFEIIRIGCTQLQHLGRNRGDGLLFPLHSLLRLHEFAPFLVFVALELVELSLSVGLLLLLPHQGLLRGGLLHQRLLVQRHVLLLLLLLLKLLECLLLLQLLVKRHLLLLL
mmetsp:Transcript_46204/g.128574  ORF Transcript_46204/g.128574 Transcript_46204/m.128574 type:complete len:400 (+) Transcript_46204:494-1693(+)